jgi:hypothetical protein
MHWKGELLHIHMAPIASSLMRPLPEAQLIAGTGLRGDRYAARLGASGSPTIDRRYPARTRTSRRWVAITASTWRPTSTGVI